ncbi:unnamed protein product [Acanthosepion pharaonis]|uniref:Uncharacterized protein n=1 Tax=Acanthosepion pharaonis TaxID=158019 RepID=A0A812D8A5_ACAPH|nr:unnamed protein product [Sepia pharaonis]
MQQDTQYSLRERGGILTLSSFTFTLFDVFTVWMPPKRRKLLGQRTAAATAARAARASETPEQTSLRLSQMASSSAACLSMESAAAQTERLASTMSSRRARLSVEERSLQNSQGAVRVARLRASQSPAQKTLRRLRDAIVKACSRSLESPEQTTSRRHRNTRATAASRALEQPRETAHRRFRNALSTASARALESPAQTTVRRVRNARSTASARVAENSEVRRQRLKNISSFRASLNGVTSPVVIDADRRPHGEHERRFNAPVCNEIAAVIHGEEHNSCDIVIKIPGGGLRRISETHVHTTVSSTHFFSIRKRWVPLQNPNMPGKQRFHVDLKDSLL